MFQVKKTASIILLAVVLSLSIGACSPEEPSLKAAYLREEMQIDLSASKDYMVCADGLPEECNLEEDMADMAGYVTSPEFKQKAGRSFSGKYFSGGGTSRSRGWPLNPDTAAKEMVSGGA